MISIDKLEYDEVIEIAKIMGYEPNKPEEFSRYITKISEMDLWDIAKILFFGNIKYLNS